MVRLINVVTGIVKNVNNGHRQLRNYLWMALASINNYCIPPQCPCQWFHNMHSTDTTTVSIVHRRWRQS